MPRLNKERQEKLEPIRMENAVKNITDLGLEIISLDSSKIDFIFKDNIIIFYPYSGWHTGKGIKDGRGCNNLLKQIKKQ
jgi:hypothetical protein